MLVIAAERLPWVPAIVFAVSMVPAGLVVAWLARRLTRGDIGRNRLLGLRTNATMASDAAWRTGQEAFGRWGVAAGLGPVIVGLGLLLRPPESIALPTVMASFAWLVGLVGIGAFLGDLAARDTAPSTTVPSTADGGEGDQSDD